VTEERERGERKRQNLRKKEKSKKRVPYINTESYLRIAHQANNLYVYTPNITLQVLTIEQRAKYLFVKHSSPVVKSCGVWNSGLEPFLGMQAVETSV
jgi:hypothetical protein